MLQPRKNTFPHRILQLSGLVVLYLSIFAFFEPQILFHPLTVISDHGDGILNYWMLAHGLQHLDSWQEFWRGNIFFPLDQTMSLSDTLLFQVLAVWPWVQVGVPPFAAYNLSIAGFFDGYQAGQPAYDPEGELLGDACRGRHADRHPQ